MTEEQQYDILIIGGGPAGLAAAISAFEKGIEKIALLERDVELGGILNQCIHNGFGLHTFNEELTGPEYASRFKERLEELKIPYFLDTTVISVENCNEYKKVIAVNSKLGVMTLRTKAIILAMGCRERPRGALNIAGYRPSGIYSAGSAQRLVNIDGVMPGKEVVILGSGDIGLIMARRMTLEGAKVKLVAELQPYSGGLKRNIVQCLDDFDIPLLLSHTVTKVHGTERLEGVTIAEVDGNKLPIKGTEKYISCDTLLLSVGLIPENELSIESGVEIDRVTSGPVVNEKFQTSIPGIFACGNVLHVHDLVDYVSEEAKKAGESAANYIRTIASDRAASTHNSGQILIKCSGGVRYTVPQLISTQCKEDILLRFRVDKIYRESRLLLKVNGKPVMEKKKKIMTPGEMENLLVPQSILKSHVPIKELELSITEG